MAADSTESSHGAQASTARSPIRTVPIVPRRLNQRAFSKFGVVLDVDGDPGSFPTAADGRCEVSLFQLEPRGRTLRALSHCAHTAHAFIPLDSTPFTIVVGPKLDELLGREFPGTNEIQAFHDDGSHGVLISPGSWYAEPFPETTGRWIEVRYEPGDEALRDEVSRNYEDILRINFLVDEPGADPVRML